MAFITDLANTLLRPSPRTAGLPFGYYLGGPTQADAEPAPGTQDEVKAIIRAVAESSSRFDADDAIRAVFDARLKYRGPDTVLGNNSEVTRALAELEASGAIRRVNVGSTGPHEWEFAAQSS